MTTTNEMKTMLDAQIAQYVSAKENAAIKKAEADAKAALLEE